MWRGQGARMQPATMAVMQAGSTPHATPRSTVQGLLNLAKFISTSGTYIALTTDVGPATEPFLGPGPWT